MKRSLFKQAALLFGAAAIMTACSSDIEPDISTTGKEVTITAKASTGTEPETRLGYEEGTSSMTFTWNNNATTSEKESFSAFVQGGGDTPATFELTAGDGTNEGTFTTTTSIADGKELYAIYPKLAAGAHKQATVKLSLAAQTLATAPEELKHNKSHYMWAKSTYAAGSDVNFDFSHKVSILKVEMTFPAGTGAIEEVRLAGVHSAATIDSATGSLTVDNTSGAAVLSDATGKALIDNKLTTYIFLFPEDLTGTDNMSLVAKDAADKLYKVTFNGRNVAAGRVYTKAVTLTEVVQLPPQVGDFYMNDGTWLPGSTALTNANKAACIGIVYWTGDPTANDDALKAAHPNCTNGLVVALKESGTSNWQSTYASYAKTVNEWTMANTTYAPIISGTELAEPINKILGYNNTKAIEAFNAANRANKVEAVDKVVTYRSTVPAPSVSSGWFLPSTKELTMLCGLDNQNSNVYINKYGTSNRDAMNAQLAKFTDAAQIRGVYYWSSTEYDGNYAWYVHFDLGYTLYYSKTLDDRVRAVLAF